MTMDLDVLRFLAAPFVASLILTGIHAYLGVHVVERGVIFVDLSLAQIASLGAAIAIWRGFDAQDPLNSIRDYRLRKVASKRIPSRIS